MLTVSEMTRSASSGVAWARATTGAGNEAVGAFAGRARQIAEEGKQRVKDHTEQNLQRLSTEVAQSETARNLINLLI